MTKIILTLILFNCFPMMAAETTQKNILILGDSISAGYGVAPEEAYPSLLQDKIDQAGLPWHVINAGVSGDTSAGGLGRIDWLLRQKVDVLLLELGGNDGLRGLSPESTEKNLQAIINKTRSKYPEVKILIAGMRMPASMGVEYTRRFEETFSSLAQKNKTAFLPFLLEGIAGKPELNQPDRIHPTPAGHKIVAENVWKVLKPLLEQGPKVSALSAGPK